MTRLTEEIAEAEARLHQLRQKALTATCTEMGHDWRHLGGKNAGCSDDCGCSVPVHECARCGDCDYGDNRWAVETLSKCAEADT